MAYLNIFVSFEFDKDNNLKNNFFHQAKELTPHRVRSSSLNEAYPDQHWQDKAQSAIRKCDIVVVLMDQDTHNAPGVKTEIKIAPQFEKPVFRLFPKHRTYTGVSEPKKSRLRWKWERINKKDR